MLAEKYNEYNVLEEQRLLKELLGVESEEEVYELIKNDMLEFTEYVDTHTTEFLTNERQAYLAFNTIFNEFMGEYKSNLEKLAALKREHLELLDLSDYTNQNNYALQDVVDTGTGSSTGPKAYTSIVGGKETTVTRNGKEIKAYIVDGYTYDEKGNRFDFREGDISHTNDGDYVWEDNRGVRKETSKTYGDGSSSLKKSGSVTDAEIKKYSEEYGVDVNTAKIMAQNGYAHKYASGIENGPVTFTGLAMLHGSSSSPEYVLNSDQAYNLLRYMATTKPDFVTNNNEAGTQYVLNGDIVLNEVEDAAQFWNEVTMAMDRRISVTKNNR